MRHNWKDFSESLHKGLRINPELGRREGWPKELYNFSVEAGGLEPYKEIVKLFESQSFEWPFPQVFWNSKINIFAAENKIYTFDSSYNLTEVKSVSTGYQWEILDYYDYLVLTNGITMIERSPATGNFITFSSDSSVPLFKTCCNFRGQAFVGNLNAWNGMDEASVAWSNIGEFNFEPSKRNEANFTRMKWNGEVFKMRELGDAIIVYGDLGIMALAPMPNSPHVGTRDLPSNGIVSRYAVDGDEHLHIFIDKEKYVWKIGRDLMPKRIGYQEYIANLNCDNVVVVCDKLYRQFYITDGSRCYLLTSYGMSEVFQCPTSVYGRQGYVFNENSTDAKVMISKNTIGYPGLKSVTSIETFSEGTVKEVCATNENDKEICVRANPQGIGSPFLAGNRIGIGAKFEEYSNAKITNIIASFIFQDKNAVRGNTND